MRWFRPKKALVQPLLRQHFGPVPLNSLVTASRTFPETSRVDLQQAITRLFSDRYQGRLLGVHPEHEHFTMTMAHLVTDSHYSVFVGPLQYDEIDIGEAAPARCLKRALWLAQGTQMPFAVLLSPSERFGQQLGLHLELAVAASENGLELSRTFFDVLEKLIHQTGSYRGKVISLEAARTMTGHTGTIKVHKLRSVPRSDVILPEKTLRLLERNVNDFIEHREQLKGLGMAAKKGLLFYGPPGTGKTHTIHYLASQLPNHTTLLITAEQVGLLDHYFQLARFLQPALVVIEDVDLIARSRENMRSACEESLLNKLLNEMDGLREDAALLFVLTTNRPDQIEAALASRPGRIDQAIEFPLPDAEGRQKLVRLYSRGLKVPDSVMPLIVKKTDKASAAFIKELMRRTAQYQVNQANQGDSAGSSPVLDAAHIECALDEMLFSGGSLNVKLLGGCAE